MNVKTPAEAANTRDKAIWIIKPEQKSGDITYKIYPVQGCSKAINYEETKPCVVCWGEDHRGNNCAWTAEGEYGRINTHWGEHKYEKKTRAKKPKASTSRVMQEGGSDDDADAAEAESLAVDTV